MVVDVISAEQKILDILKSIELILKDIRISLETETDCLKKLLVTKESQSISFESESRINSLRRNDE